MRKGLAALVGFGVLAGAGWLGGCKPPKYILYRSELGDYTVQVPWGWSVYLDKQGSDFASYTFVGPFDPDFHLGVPSLSIRWHAHHKLHHLRDGSFEVYSSGEEYMRKMVTMVYGPEYQYVQRPQRIAVSGWEGKHFIVESLAEVPDSYQYGVSVDPSGKKSGVVRKHAYVVLPMDNGFYSLVYPATREGFAKHEKQFNQLVNTFAVLTDGPGGPKAK